MARSLRAAANQSRWQKTLLSLEQRLLDPTARQSPKELEELILPDFVEFGSSGQVYSRQTMIEMMARETSASVVIRDFEVRALNDDAALVTYRSIGQGGQEARRSSIWIREDTEWRLAFHQGTRIPDRWGGIS